MSLRPTVDFLLHDWLKVGSLQSRERYSDHSRETLDAVRDTCERIAREKYAPFNRLADIEEPRTVTEPDGSLRVVLPQATHDAQKAYADSGMLSAAQDYEMGGMQLPYTVEAAANAFFAMASVSIGSGMLTTGNANLLMVHGTELQKTVFAKNEFNGRFSGTMCLSEPQAGSSLSDITTRAVPDGAGFEAEPLGARYRLKGNKMWISTGEHELTENIIHLVLAKIPDEHGKLPAGHTRHFTVHRAQENSRCQRRTDRRAQRRGLGRSEPQTRLARHYQHLAQLWRGQVPGAEYGRWFEWGGRGRGGLPRGQARRRPALHVPHDERGPHWRGHGRHHAGHGRLLRQP